MTPKVHSSPDVSGCDFRGSATSVLTAPRSLQLTACALPAVPTPITPDASGRAERPQGIGDVRNPQKVADPLCEPLNWVIREGGTSVVLKA